MIAAKRKNDESSGEKEQKKPKFEKKNPFQRGKPTFKKGFKPNNKTNDSGRVNKFKKPDGKDGKFDKNQENPAPVEKKDWNKFKQEKKDLKKTRKATKYNFDKMHDAKQLYEKLKCKATPKNERDEICKELHKMFRGGETYQKFVMAHDTTRIVQCLLKHSPPEICKEISESLMPVVGKLAISDYAHFCVPRLLKYGQVEIKKRTIEAMYGNIISMLSRPKSSPIIDNIYISYANSQQKALMRQELYGDLYKTSKDKEVKSINDTYKDSPHMKLAVMNAVKSNLERIANKQAVDNSLLHAVLLDYLNECGEEDRNEIITLFLPHIPSLVSTRDGVRAAMICFWHSIVKDRRAVLKTIREHLVKICTHEHGHIFILALINSTDDTKALKKSIFDPIFADIEKIAGNEWGRKVIEWFVAPADTACYHPHTIALLEEGLQYSKKDKEVRRAELLEGVDDSLCKAISENGYFWLRGGHMALTTCNILKNCKGTNVKNALNALADVVCNVEWIVPLKEPTEDEDKKASQTQIKKKLEANDANEEKKEEKPELIAGVEHAGLHIAMKKLLKLTDFPASLADKLTDDVIASWLALNRPSFLLLNAYENGNESVQSRIKSLIGNHLKLLKKQNHAASKLLITKLDL